MKQMRIEPLGIDLAVQTSTNVVAALLNQADNRVKMVCGGRGLCATCHVKVVDGKDALSSLTDRERATLSRISGAGITSRLACQAKIVRDGAVLELPDGIYLQSLADVEALIGRRADSPLFHPISGIVLVPIGKIITRSVVTSLNNLDQDIVTSIIRNSDIAKN